MQKFNKSSSLKSFLFEEKNKNTSIGFVPTMGSLHQGHLSLVRKSKLENILKTYLLDEFGNNTLQ